MKAAKAVKKALLVLAFLSFSACALFAQVDFSSVEVKPYSADEFPKFALDMRRSEIIMLGSFPFTTMVAGAGYSLFRYFRHGMDSAYRPTLFVKYSSSNFSDKEQMGVILGAAGASVCIGLADFIIERVVQNLEYKNALASGGAEGALDPDITIIPVYKGGSGAGGAEAAAGAEGSEAQAPQSVIP